MRCQNNRVIATKKNGCRDTFRRWPDELETLKSFRHGIGHVCEPGSPLSVLSDSERVHDLDGVLPWLNPGEADSEAKRESFFEALLSLLQEALFKYGDAKTDLEARVDFARLARASPGYVINPNDMDSDLQEMLSKSVEPGAAPDTTDVAVSAAGAGPPQPCQESQHGQVYRFALGEVWSQLYVVSGQLS